MKIQRTIKLGTRGSLLALAQARKVQERLMENIPSLEVEIIPIKTSGDKIVDRPLQEIGGKALFVKELEEALLDREIDLAVHSVKDMERPLPKGLILAGVLEREDPRDVWISHTGCPFREMPQKAKIGTCSPRRAAQILAYRPDIALLPLRGNIDTRLQKLAAGHYDGIILAYAGLKRIHRTECITEILEPDIMLPAVGQGVIGMEIREEDQELQDLLKGITHEETFRHLHVEFKFLEGFEGDCFTPLAGWCSRHEASLHLLFEGMVILPNGRKSLRKSLQGEEETLSLEAYALGQEFKEWYAQNMK